MQSYWCGPFEGIGYDMGNLLMDIKLMLMSFKGFKMLRA